jgi:hypothetical protein
MTMKTNDLTGEQIEAYWHGMRPTILTKYALAWYYARGIYRFIEWFHDKNNQERLAYLNMVADDQDKAGLTCTAEDYRLTVQWIEGLLRELNEGAAK